MSRRIITLYLLVAAHVGFAGGAMLVDVVFGLEYVLDLLGGSIELHPLLVGRLGDAVSFDAGRL